MSEKPTPILLDFPDRIETERLILRAPRPGDGPAVNEGVNASLEHLKPWMPWAQEPQTVEQTEEYVREAAARWLKREDLPLLIFRREDNRYLGGSGLHRINWSVPRFEIGYWIRPEAEGQGYVSEAVRALTIFAFATLKAERVEIRCDGLNRRSAAVAERCSFTLEGTLRHDDRDPDGSLRDTLVFSMIREEWLKAK